MLVITIPVREGNFAINNNFIFYINATIVVLLLKMTLIVRFIREIQTTFSVTAYYDIFVAVSITDQSHGCGALVLGRKSITLDVVLEVWLSLLAASDFLECQPWKEWRRSGKLCSEVKGTN